MAEVVPQLLIHKIFTKDLLCAGPLRFLDISRTVPHLCFFGLGAFENFFDRSVEQTAEVGRGVILFSNEIAGHQDAQVLKFIPQNFSGACHMPCTCLSLGIQ